MGVAAEPIGRGRGATMPAWMQTLKADVGKDLRRKEKKRERKEAKKRRKKEKKAAKKAKKREKKSSKKEKKSSKKRKRDSSADASNCAKSTAVPQPSTSGAKPWQRRAAGSDP